MVDIPFVSEEFQRSFRNQFPSQTQTGRDLHVSDVVIPIVDFTPTTAGNSLPLSLSDALNRNTVSYNIATATTTVVGSAGFTRLNFEMSEGTYEIVTNINDGTTNYRINKLYSGPNSVVVIPFVVYAPVGHTINVQSFTSGNNVSIMSTLLADVDGNQVNPFGYNPQ